MDKSDGDFSNQVDIFFRVEIFQIKSNFYLTCRDFLIQVDPFIISELAQIKCKNSYKQQQNY